MVNVLSVSIYRTRNPRPQWRHGVLHYDGRRE
jgi:hypothetical protein